MARVCSSDSVSSVCLLEFECHRLGSKYSVNPLIVVRYEASVFLKFLFRG